MATEDVRPWVTKLARIMELEASDPNGYPRMIFIRGRRNRTGRDAPIGSLDENLVERLPKIGWKVFRLPAVQIWSHRDVPDVICDIGHGEDHEREILKMLQILNPIFHKAKQAGGLPFHAALAERNGMGILLAGPGDTGKSTCCHRFPGPWKALCDDESLVVRDHQNRYFAHPFPTWSDYLFRRSEPTWNVQRHCPLTAIFFLEQAENDQVVAIGGGNAAALITQSASQIRSQDWFFLDPEEVRGQRKLLFDNACEMAKAIPAYILRVSLNGRFWEEMEKVLE
jgi:SynChlorMet cassette protein ScmC